MAKGKPEADPKDRIPRGESEETRDLKERLALAEERYAKLFDLHPDPMVVHDEEGVLIEVNRSFCERTGFSRNDVIGKSVREALPFRDTDQDLSRKYLEAISREGVAHGFEAEYLRADGSKVICEVSGRLIEFNGRRRIVSILRDISDEKAAQRMMRESETLYQETFNQSPAVKLLIDPQSLAIIDANAAAAEFYGYPTDRIKEMSLLDINTVSEDEIRANFDLAAAGAESRFVYRHRLASGEIRDVEAYAGFIELGGRQVLHSIIHDITDKVRAEEELKRLVAEKETLLKELQHRVKNNLGVIASLLSLSAGKVEDEEAREAFAGAIARVESIASIYTKLYGTKDLASIELGSYAEDLVKSLFATYNLDPDRIRLKGRYDSARLDLKRCAPFGLILNELLTNALKYAYPGEARGEIRVELKAEGGMIELSVVDDGPGIPPEVLEGRSSGLGMTLVGMLTKQLGARLDIDCSRGSRVALSFEA